MISAALISLLLSVGSSWLGVGLGLGMTYLLERQPPSTPRPPSLGPYR